eukprot:TRINITY_DN27854_c1_g1_i11.p2 TRINITY_DN27854_c1_g1~~TRINITY_DN27854_c1_g1_i11.p2  ORF type:complete len:203 (+),score=55.91 TRINITY_DN27854_c1_g1_i11:30-611(+)
MVSCKRQVLLLNELVAPTPYTSLLRMIPVVFKMHVNELMHVPFLHDKNDKHDTKNDKLDKNCMDMNDKHDTKNDKLDKSCMDTPVLKDACVGNGPANCSNSGTQTETHGRVDSCVQTEETAVPDAVDSHGDRFMTVAEVKAEFGKHLPDLRMKFEQDVRLKVEMYEQELREKDDLIGKMTEALKSKKKKTQFA